MHKTFIKRVITTFLGNGFSKILLIAFEFLLAIYIGRKSYGEFAICYSFLLLTSNILQIGLNYGIVQFLSIYQEQNDIESSHAVIQVCLIIFILLGTISGLTIYYYSTWLASNFFAKPQLQTSIIIISICIPFKTLNLGFSAIFRGLREAKKHIYSYDLIQNITLFLFFPLIVYYQSLTMALMLLTISCIFTSFWSFYQIKHMLRTPILWKKFQEIFAKIIRFSYSMSIWNILQQLSSSSQIVVVATLITSEDVAILSIFLRIITIFTFFQSIANFTAPVEYARLYYLKDYQQLKHFFRNISFTLLVIVTTAALPIMITPQFFLSFISNIYSLYYFLLWPLLIAQLINIGTGPTGQLLIACEQQNSLFVVSCVGALLKIFLVIFMTSSFGLTGAVYSEAIIIFVLTALRQIVCIVKLNIHCFSFTFIYLICLSIFSYSIGYQILNHDNHVNILLKILLGYLVYLSGLAFLVAKNPKITMRIKKLFKDR